MKILVFEYITGGGLNKQQLPASLLTEGHLMLTDLLANLAELNHINVVLMLDTRLASMIAHPSLDIVLITAEHDTSTEFSKLIADADAVLPIAPEFDGILQALCTTVTDLGKPLLTSNANAVAITADKWLTYQHLKAHAIATVETQVYTGVPYTTENNQQWLVKPRDGVGCIDCQVISNSDDFQTVTRQNRLIQPHLTGKKTSLSCLFKNGWAWLLCVNLQEFTLVDQHYHLVAIQVNIAVDTTPYNTLIANIANALPDLWGYVGIDLIETTEQILVLEINPRLTTSFAGIQSALGINVVALLLQLLGGEPEITPTCQQTVRLTLA